MEASKPTFDAQKYGHNDGPSGTKNYWLSILTVLGCFVLFIAVVFVAYLPPNSVDSTGQTEVVQARLTRLEEMRAKEATAATQYAWVDKEKGVVRIPVERAVELLPAHLKQKGVKMAPAAATPAASAAPTAAVAPAAAAAVSGQSAAAAPAQSTDSSDSAGTSVAAAAAAASVSSAAPDVTSAIPVAQATAVGANTAAPAHSTAAAAAIASGLIDTSVDLSADIGEDAADAAIGK